MRYVSIDLETTGLDPAHDQILQLAMVYEDTELTKAVPVEELPTFVCYVHHDRLTGSGRALAMNGWLIDEIYGGKTKARHQVLGPGGMATEAEIWLRKQLRADERRLTAAGKNVAGFDMLFLPPDLRQLFTHRCIDVGSVMIDWTESLPLSLQHLIKRHLDPMKDQSHDALDDARDVIRLLRRTY